MCYILVYTLNIVLKISQHKKSKILSNSTQKKQDPIQLISNITVMDLGFIDNSVSFNQFVRTSDKSRESLTLKNNVFEGNSFDES
jgi:hypothetical protein